MSTWERKCLLVGTLITVLSLHGFAQGVIFNEVFNAGSNEEWAELLVVQDSLDMRGWDMRDFSSGGAAQQPLIFSTNAVWNNLRAGTIIVVARPEMTSLSEDIDPSDYSLVIKASNAAFFSGNPFLFAGSSDAIQIRSTGSAHVFGVSWGASNSTSIPNPKVHFSSSSSSGTSISFNEDSVPELTSTTNWTFNNGSATLGLGNTPTNASWISTLRSRADGSGSATIEPDTLNGGTTTTLQITYRPDTQFTVTDLRIIVPPLFSWSHSPTDVSYTNMTATLSVSGDTVSFNGVSFSADSTVISLANVTAPDSTSIYSFTVQSRVNSYGNVLPSPRIVVFGQPIPIADVKENDTLGVPLLVNQLVTVRGIVTVSNQFGSPSYIQDNTAGIAVYGFDFSNAVQEGDEVVVSGLVQPFNGLNEIVNPLLHAIVTSGNPIQPNLVDASQIANDGIHGVELYEGSLVRLNNVNVIGSGTWLGNTNYPLYDVTDTTEVRISVNTNIVGTPIPAGSFDMIAVVGQFIQAPPYIGGYQLMPRSTADIVATGPVISTFPRESNIQSTSLTITWQTLYNGTSYIRYGTTPGLEVGVIGNDTLQTTHTLLLPGLAAATVYYIQAFSVSGSDTSTATTLIASTASPAQSSGEMNVFFNKSVDTRIAWYQNALGNQDFVSKIIPLINAAQRSIDVALYSLSGTPGDFIASALVMAKNRGVKVRVICEADNRNTNAFTTISSAGIPLIDDRFDLINGGAGLMHNKFFVFDARGGAPESIWVWTGSWNPTDPGTNNDYQNSIEIQDAALANAYTMEFNEMWGSATDVPNQAASRFGARKTDNTPHRFLIAGTAVESYFSPSDRTTSHILSIIADAGHSIAFALLTLTRSDIANAIIAKKNLGLAARGLLDNNTDQGSQYDYLVSQGVDMHLKTGSGLLHHKYGIIDGENPYWNATTITGSHNWTNSAENSNNENTLIVRNGNIANQYLQEFSARYLQFGGTDTIMVGVNRVGPDLPAAFALSQNFPNPFNPATRIQFQLPERSKVVLKVYNIIGQEVLTLVNDVKSAGTYRVDFNAGGLASGVYFYKLEAGTFVSTKKMMLLK